MLRVDRICIWVIILGAAVLTLSYQYIKFIDELCVLLLGSVALLDCFVNRQWKKYSFMFLLMGIMTFYALYSGLFLNNNTWRYILMDWVIELKPYVPFAVLLAVAPKLEPADKKILKWISIANATFCCLLFLGGHQLVTNILFHVTYGGCTLFISSIFIIYCSLDDKGQLSRRDLLLSVFYLTFGLACTRSKYYGLYVLCMFFLFYYKPGMFKSVTFKHVLMIAGVFAMVLLVSWDKISYYFLTGAGDKFDPTVAASFARPVLYGTGGLIFIDYFPFGSGLASFASYPSGVGYSNVYYEYGINNVFGLSPQTGFYICDAFYPSLAQFGVFGVMLFIGFWVYACQLLKKIIRFDPSRFKYPFIIGTLIICFIAIENTGGNTFTQSPGMLSMCLLGTICGMSKLIRTHDSQVYSDAGQERSLHSFELKKIN